MIFGIDFQRGSPEFEPSPCVFAPTKIKLPPCFTELSDQGSLDKGPMHFKLSRVDMKVSLGSDVPSASDLTIKQDPGTTHSGVLGFTAREGSVELPPCVWSNLFSDDAVEEGMFNYYKFSIDDSIRERITSGSKNIEVRLEAETSDGDADIFATRHPLVFPTQHHREWLSHETGSKVLILDPKDQNLVAGTYSIGICGFKGLTRYRISLSLKDNNTQKGG